MKKTFYLIFFHSMVVNDMFIALKLGGLILKILEVKNEAFKILWYDSEN